MVILSLINVAYALLIWYQVVRNRGSALASLVTYGIVVPVSAFLPFQVIALLDLRNTVLAMPIATVPLLNVLRCMEGEPRNLNLEYAILRTFSSLSHDVPSP